MSPAVVSFTRSALALIVLLLAVAAGLGGLAAQWVDRAARTPEPLQGIVAPLASDPVVREALTTEITEAVLAKLPDVAANVPLISDQLTKLVTQAVDQTLSDPEVLGAWDESISISRVDYVARLDELRNGGDAPTVWLNVDPLVDVGMNRLEEITPELVRPFVSQLRPTEEVRVALGRPDAVAAGYAADGLALARNWGWFYAAGAALAAAGLLIGSRTGRWVAWILATAAGLAALLLGGRLVAGFAVNGSQTLTGAVQKALLHGAKADLSSWIAPAVTVGWVLLAVGFLALAWTLLTRRRRSPAVPRPS